TDGDQRATLAVVRALGEAGVRVTVGENTRTSLAGASHYCHRQVQYPSPILVPREFQEFLREEAQRAACEMLVPMTDETTLLVAEILPEIGSQVRVPLPGAECVQRVQDKGEVLRVAKSLGIGCPETFALEHKSDLEAIAKTVRYPVVIKPRFSR